MPSGMLHVMSHATTHPRSKVRSIRHPHGDPGLRGKTSQSTSDRATRPRTCCGAPTSLGATASRPAGRWSTTDLSWRRRARNGSPSLRTFRAGFHGVSSPSRPNPRSSSPTARSPGSRCSAVEPSPTGNPVPCCLRPLGRTGGSGPPDDDVGPRREPARLADWRASGLRLSVSVHVAADVLCEHACVTTPRSPGPPRGSRA